MARPSPLPEAVLSDEEVSQLRSQLQRPIACEHNINLLSPYTRQQREYFAYKTGTMVLYLGDEVRQLNETEEQAALRACPPGHDLSGMIGLNIGCGSRTVSPYLLPVDIMRQHHLGTSSGEHASLTSNAFLAHPDKLPFQKNSVDLIIALHMLEHIEDPVGVIHHWLDIIKPGGGIGIVVPDWRFTWDSRTNFQPFAHKWNATRRLIEMLYERHWKRRATLEHLNTYDFALSFDFVLRKHGKFVAFAPPDPTKIRSGQKLDRLGLFLSEDTFSSPSWKRLARIVRAKVRARKFSSASTS